MPKLMKKGIKLTQSEREENFKKLYILTGRLFEKKSLKEKTEMEIYVLAEEVIKIKNLLKEGERNEE